MIVGNVHSCESFGTVDGPGLRYVVFLQGCPLRCKFCHNPDTWLFSNTKKYISVDDLVEEISKYENFFKKTGGVTITGGEPMMQADFVALVLQYCKEKGYHTAIDTSGFIFNNNVKNALEYTDLVLLDIKCIDKTVYKELVGVEIDNTLEFAKYCSDNGIKMWIRHVLGPLRHLSGVCRRKTSRLARSHILQSV